MRVSISFVGLPDLKRELGSRAIPIDFNGRTIRELIRTFTGSQSQKVRAFLLDSDGELDGSFQFLLNESDWISSDKLDTEISEGDSLQIMMLLAGG